MDDDIAISGRLVSNCWEPLEEHLTKNVSYPLSGHAKESTILGIQYDDKLKFF